MRPPRAVLVGQPSVGGGGVKGTSDATLKQEKRRACSVCGERPPWRAVNSTLEFEGLTGKPVACERCIFKALTGQAPGWRHEP